MPGLVDQRQRWRVGEADEGIDNCTEVPFKAKRSTSEVSLAVSRIMHPKTKIDWIPTLDLHRRS